MVADVSSPTAAFAAVTSGTAAVDGVTSLTAAVVAVEGVTVIASDIATGRSPRDNRSPTDPSSSSPSTKSESPSVSTKTKVTSEIRTHSTRGISVMILSSHYYKYAAVNL
jgi:hypothetical protein